MLNTKPAKEIIVRMPNDIGALDRMAKAIADRGVNILAVSAWVEGAQATQLLADRLGTDVPLAALRYWVLGTPAPGLPFNETAGANGLPRVFEQAGWQVSVDRWQAVSGNWLPVRMTAEQGEARIKLAVSRWNLAP